MYSAALVIAFLAAKNENRQLEDLPRADLAVYLKDYSVGKDKVNERENFVNWKLHNHCFCNHESTHISILSLSVNVLYDLFGNCRFLYFHSLIKSAFSFRPRPCSTSPPPFFFSKAPVHNFSFLLGATLSNKPNFTLPPILPPPLNQNIRTMVFLFFLCGDKLLNSAKYRFQCEQRNAFCSRYPLNLDGDSKNTLPAYTIYHCIMCCCT